MTKLMQYALEEVRERAEVEEDERRYTATFAGVISDEASSEGGALDNLEGHIDDNFTWQQIVIAISEDFSLDDLSYTYNDSEVSCGPRFTWLVLTESESNQAILDHLNNYLDEFVLPEIPQKYHTYFDREAWIRDNEADACSELATHDGNEKTFTLGTEEVYIYRR